MRTFTTDGPGDETRHYILPAAPRLAEARSLVDQGAYFVLRAPGRTGKTTALRALASEITAEGRYAALMCSAAVAAPARADLALVQEALLSAMRIAAEQDLPPPLRPPPFPTSAEATRLWEGISAWARVCPRPLVLFFDDLDTLQDAALDSVLRQLETGFSRRPEHFAWSIGLASQFDLRVSHSSPADTSKTPASTGPFERFWSSRLLPPFTENEIRALYAEHFGSAERGFSPEALAFVYEASAGHPFLVQAFGREMAAMTLPTTGPIAKSHVIAAYRQLIEQAVSPIDALASRLAEPRIRRVIEPLLLGSAAIASVDEADVQHVRDIGLVAFDDPVRIEGSLHRALVPRLLSQGVQRAVIDDPASCFESDGRLSMERLLQSFAAFYTGHASELIAATPYSKIAPELVFLGYLLRMLSGRGWIDFEFGASRGRIDVTISVEVKGNHSEESIEPSVTEQRELLVLVTRRKGDSGVKKRGLEWLDDALQRTSSVSGTLVVFDKRDKRLPGKRTKLREIVLEGKTVRLLRV